MKTPKKPQAKKVTKAKPVNKIVKKGATTLADELLHLLLTENPRKLTELLTITNEWHDEQLKDKRNLTAADWVYHRAQLLACRTWSSLVQGSPMPSTCDDWEKKLVAHVQELSIDSAKIVLQLQKGREPAPAPVAPG